MKNYKILHDAIVKSASGPDETKYLLSALDACLAEEIEATDKLLLKEIFDLELRIARLLAEADSASQTIIEQTIKENQLKSAFTRDSE